MLTGVGASAGMGLITEGVADAFTAVRTVQTRDFDWSGFLVQKAVSVLISIGTGGLGSAK